MTILSMKQVQILLLLGVSLAIYMFIADGMHVYLIAGESMKPTFDKYAVVVTKQLISYYKGDIISFKKGQQVITHRIVDTKETPSQLLHYTKGDNNKISDDMPLTANEILGKVIWYSNIVGKIIGIVVIERYGILILLLILGYITGMQLHRLAN